MAATACASELINAAIERPVTEAGLEKLKAEQVQVIHQFVSGKDVFVSLATGCGKSLCNALLPLVLDLLRSGDSGRSIVVRSYDGSKAKSSVHGE